MINEEETFKRFGYMSTDLKPKSNKRIVAICDECGKIREIRKGSYRLLCSFCALHTEERGTKISKALKGGKRPTMLGEKNPNWKGGMIKKICEECGKEFNRKLSAIKRGKNRFCSYSCAYKGRKRPNTSGENNPRWKGGPSKRICEICGKTFERKYSAVKRGKGRFCSQQCYNEWQAKDKQWQEHMKQMRKEIHQTPTKPERIFQEICKKNNLDFHYVGDGQLWIGKKRKLNPDFIEANGKKICIEIFGDYWHSPLLNRNMKEYSTLGYRKRHYQKYNWHSVFIWESDLLRKDAEQFVLNELQKGVL